MTILMATLLCSVLLFCLALENGHMKAYRDESVRLQLIHLVHTVQALSLAFIIPFAIPFDFICCLAVSDVSRKMVFFLRLSLLWHHPQSVFRSHSWSC